MSEASTATQAELIGSEMRKHMAEQIVGAMTDGELSWLCEILALKMSERHTKRQRVMETMWEMKKAAPPAERTR